MEKDLLRRFDEVCNTGVAIAGYTSGLCGEWVEERFSGNSSIVMESEVICNEDMKNNIHMGTITVN